MSVPAEGKKSGPEGGEEIMNTILTYGNKLIGKAALTTVALAGFLAFFGAGTASAQPVVYVYARPNVVVVGPGFYGPRFYRPRPVYVGPVYRPHYRPYAGYRYWDARFHCWRYR
jgi:hypothetical protein